MTDIPAYKGCGTKVEFDADDQLFFGRVTGIDDGVSFHADSVDGLVAAFREAVDDYLDLCAKIGKSPDKA